VSRVHLHADDKRLHVGASARRLLSIVDLGWRADDGVVQLVLQQRRFIRKNPGVGARQIHGLGRWQQIIGRWRLVDERGFGFVFEDRRDHAQAVSDQIQQAHVHGRDHAHST